MKRLSRPVLYFSLVVLAFVAVVIGIRTFNHQFVIDEVAYHFSFMSPRPIDQSLWFHADKRIETISDAVISQIGHYKLTNGRALVHFAEQVFSGPLPFWLFCAVNSLVFALFVCLLTKLARPRGDGAAPLCLTLTICALLYVFPENHWLWTSINLSPNYLWPATLMCAVLLAMRRLQSEDDLSRPAKLGIIVLSFVCGWSNEAVSLPLSGAMVAMLARDTFRHKGLRNQKSLTVIIPLWVGTIALLLSPGNWHRLSRTSEGMTPTDMLKDLYTFIMDVRFLWILAAILLIWAVANRSAAKRFVVDNIFYFIIAAFSLFLVIIAHTGPRSMMAGEVCCLILTVKIVIGFLSRVASQKALLTTTLVMALLLVGHQTLLARDTIRYHEMEKRLMAEYVQSADGVVLFDEVDLSPLTKPYIRRIYEANGIGTYGIMSTLQLWTGREDADFVLLRAADYKAVADPENFYRAENRTSFTAPVYHGGGRFYWVHPDSMVSGKVEVHLRPDSVGEKAPLLTKVRFKYFPRPVVLELEVDTVRAAQGEFYRIIPDAYLLYQDIVFSTK